MLPNLSRLEKHASQPTAGNAQSGTITVNDDVLSLMEELCVATQLDYHIMTIGLLEHNMCLAITSNDFNALDEMSRSENVMQRVEKALRNGLTQVQQELPVPISYFDRFLRDSTDWVDDALAIPGVEDVIFLSYPAPNKMYNEKYAEYINLKPYQWQQLQNYVTQMRTNVLFVVLTTAVSRRLQRYVQWLHDPVVNWGFLMGEENVSFRRRHFARLYEHWAQRVGNLEASSAKVRKQYERQQELIQKYAASHNPNAMLPTITTDDFLHVFVFSYIVNALAESIGDTLVQRPTLIFLPAMLTDDTSTRRKDARPVQQHHPILSGFGRRQVITFLGAYPLAICKLIEQMRKKKMRNFKSIPNFPPDPSRPPPKGDGGSGPGGGGGGPSNLFTPTPGEQVSQVH